MGVLQRLAITYFFTSLLHLAFDKLFFIRKKNNLLEKDNGKRVLKENLITKSNYYCLSNNQLGISKKYLQYINYGLIVQIFVIFILRYIKNLKNEIFSLNKYFKENGIYFNHSGINNDINKSN